MFMRSMCKHARPHRIIILLIEQVGGHLSTPGHPRTIYICCAVEATCDQMPWHQATRSADHTAAGPAHTQRLRDFVQFCLALAARCFNDLSAVAAAAAAVERRWEVGWLLLRNALQKRGVWLADSKRRKSPWWRSAGKRTAARKKPHDVIGNSQSFVCDCDCSALLIASSLVRISGSFREILRAPQSS